MRASASNHERASKEPTISKEYAADTLDLLKTVKVFTIEGPLCGSTNRFHLTKMTQTTNELSMTASNHSLIGMRSRERRKDAPECACATVFGASWMGHVTGQPTGQRADACAQVVRPFSSESVMSARSSTKTRSNCCPERMRECVRHRLYLTVAFNRHSVFAIALASYF